MMGLTEKQVKVVILAKEEEKNLPFVIDRVLKVFDADNVVAVLDGILEPSRRILLEKGIIAMSGPNKGKGAAIRFAIKHITATFFVFMDADGSHDPEEIYALIELLITNKADMSIASRYLGSSEELGGTVGNFIRNIGNIVSSYLINSFWNKKGEKILDCQNGFRAIRRDVMLDLNLQEDGFAIEQEMVIQCFKKGYRIREVPSNEYKRRYGLSHLSIGYFYEFVLCAVRSLFY